MAGWLDGARDFLRRMAWTKAKERRQEIAASSTTQREILRDAMSMVGEHVAQANRLSRAALELNRGGGHVEAHRK